MYISTTLISGFDFRSEYSTLRPHLHSVFLGLSACDVSGQLSVITSLSKLFISSLFPSVELEYRVRLHLRY
jgi:hypothetical protein